jgi:hypothetical protein
MSTASATPVSKRRTAGRRTLTPAELNRATLERQLLLRRRRLPLLRAIERVGGLQGQWVPSPYVGLWSRLDGFRRDRLSRAVIRREVVKATLMRGTLHLVTAADYPIFSSALHADGASMLDADVLAFAERVAPGMRAFFGGRPRSRAEAFAWLEARHGKDLTERMPWTAWHAIRVRGHVVHAPESATWNAPNSPMFIALEGVELPSPATARIELVRRYLAAFGPATRADLADWSGLRVRDFAAALDALEPLRRFSDDRGRELLDLRGAPLPPGDRPAPVRLLPKWDSVLLAHKDRRRVLPDEYRSAVIGNNGDVARTFLIDGTVAGTWSLVHGNVTLRPFAPVPRRAQRELDEEARRMEAFVA